MSDLYVGIEAGGTKFVAGVADLSDPSGPRLVDTEVEIPTGAPANTIERIAAELQVESGSLAGLGIGAFGPIGVHRRSADYGLVAATPKPGWAGTDLLGLVRSAFGLSAGFPMGFDTDVNAAAIAEWRWGAAQRRSTSVYLTVGTGIGGGAVVHGRPLHGLVHPEMGHITVPRHPDDDFPGACDVHGDCLEGLASGPAIEARTGVRGTLIPDDDPVWEMEAWYLARGLAGIVLVLSPSVISLGGGVMRREHLYGRIALHLDEAMAGYVGVPEIVKPHFGSRNGLMGAFALAEAATRRH